jgi:hypothetical protein
VAARRDPIREWRDGFARGMHSIDFRPAPEVPFHASVVPILHGVRTMLSAGFTFRDEELVKDRGGDAFSLVLSRSKSLEVAQLGHEVRLGHGDATLLHVGETGHVGSNEDFEFIVQMIPYAEVASRGACLDASVTRRLPAQTEALQLLRSTRSKGASSPFQRKQARWPIGTSSTSPRLLSPRMRAWAKVD